MLALHRRDTAELLAEELRRLDPDEVYAETLGHILVSPAGEPPRAAAAAADSAAAEEAFQAEEASASAGTSAAERAFEAQEYDA
jgi:hypothetical protein